MASPQTRNTKAVFRSSLGRAALLVMCGLAWALPCSILRSILLAQEGAPSVWKADIKESDMDVRSLRALLLSGKRPPESLRLRYSRAYLNYAVFYDLRGREVFFRYRRDRFDRKAEKRLRGLIPGQAYEVQAGESLEGLRLDGIFYKTSDANFSKHLPHADSVLVFRFAGATPLRLEQILF